MTFPKKLLHDGEEIVIDLVPHWSTLAGPAAATIGALVLTIVLYTVNHWAALVGAVLLVAAAVWLAARAVSRQFTNLTVTTTRLVHRTGIVAKHAKEIPLERITNIESSQSIFERMIGAGDLIIESAGKDSREVFSHMPHPGQIQNQVYAQIEANQGRQADRAAGRHDLSVPEQLEKLAELRDRGVLTPAEFEAKKQQLLDRL